MRPAVIFLCIVCTAPHFQTVVSRSIAAKIFSFEFRNENLFSGTTCASLRRRITSTAGYWSKFPSATQAKPVPVL